MRALAPPFRADHVGSLLRPAELLAARAGYRDGSLDGPGLRAVEDRSIAAAVRRQREVGLRGVTDGEFRRTFFHIDFLEKLAGVTVAGGIPMKFKGTTGEVDFAPPRLTVTGKLRHVEDIQRADLDYLCSAIGNGDGATIPKVAIPSPTMVHFRGGRQAIDIDAYPDLERFFADLAECYRAEIAALYAGGCRYLQLDDTNLAYLCDPKHREAVRARGEDPDDLPRAYAQLINQVLEGRAADLTVAIHLCRGNFQSAWVAEGGYEPVAEVLFNAMHVDAYFLEYDDERSGDFAPLRFVPPDKTVVLGLVTSKTGALEAPGEVAARIGEAARYVPLDKLCLSPQCGFSSTVHGNVISEAEQWAKLELVVAVARDVWGEV